MIDFVIFGLCIGFIIAMMIGVSLHFIWRILSHYSSDNEACDSKDM